MKRSIYNVGILLFFFTGTVFAKGDVSREKTISRTYEADASTKLSIENQFGQVHINTWTKKYIEVEVKVVAYSKTEAKAQEMVDRINIIESKSPSNIIIKTQINQMSTLNVGMSREKYEIEYTVNMPASNPLSINNKFGDVYMAAFSGKLDLQVAYGNITIDELKGGDKYIKVSFGSARILSMESGRVESSYSKLDIDDATHIDVKNMFGGTEIRGVKTLKIDQQYGSLQVDNVDQISGKVAFSNMNIDELIQSADLNLKYCSRADFGSISSTVNLIKVNANFSNLYFDMDNTASLNFDMNFKFGEFKSSDDEQINMLKTSKDSDTRSYQYQGRIGRGQGTMFLSVNYGNVYF